MGASFRIGRVFGILIEINARWGIVFFLLTFQLALAFGESRLGWPVAQRWTVAMAMTISFFLSVLTHELSPSVFAKREVLPAHVLTHSTTRRVARHSRVGRSVCKRGWKTRDRS